MKLFSKLNLISIALASIFLNLSIASADTKLSIGSCPIGCTAYTWSAGIADVIWSFFNCRRNKGLCGEYQTFTE